MSLIVSFTRMDEGTREDYALLDRFEREHVARLPERILAALEALDQSLEGYRVTRLEHSLQSATRAEADGADIEMIVGALVHDLGDDLAPLNHSQLAASIVRPYVREEVTWVLAMHGLFQMPYYAHHLDLPTDGHLAHADHPWYDSGVRFCRDWDQTAFDPDYPTRDLAHFAPMVREVFSRPAFDPAILRPEGSSATEVRAPEQGPGQEPEQGSGRGRGQGSGQEPAQRSEQEPTPER